jgi:hypothetical protein
MLASLIEYRQQFAPVFNRLQTNLFGNLVAFSLGVAWRQQSLLRDRKEEKLLCMQKQSTKELPAARR